MVKMYGFIRNFAQHIGTLHSIRWIVGKTFPQTQRNTLYIQQMKTISRLIILLIAAIVLASCGKQQPPSNSYLHEDDVRYAADISFEPIVQELADLFNARHPEATMLPNYCDEDSAIRLLVRDSVRLAITTRKLTEGEKALIRQQKHNFKQSLIAHDAFALIVNKHNPDTVINMNEIKGIISGKITDWKQLEVTHKSGPLYLLFDHSGSSTVRFMKDSLNGGKPLGGNVFAQGDNEAVIKAVKEREDVIGVVSTDWLRVSKGDTCAMENFHDLDVKVMLVGFYGLKDPLGLDAKDWQRPYQYYIATGEYPLFRGVYAICTDSRPKSMTSMFYFFTKGDGQRVICNSSQLLPHTQVQVRNVVAK